jgi:hypothetical protein
LSLRQISQRLAEAGFVTRSGRPYLAQSIDWMLETRQ